MQYSENIIGEILRLSKLGYASRKIAEVVLGSPTKKSTVNYILSRVGSPKESTTKEDNSRVLLISDLHIPYHHPQSIDFLRYLKKKYNPTRVISLGDECFPPEVEILTEAGFVRFDNLGDQKVAQWSDNREISFVTPLRKVEKEYVGNLLQFQCDTMVSRTTPNHNLIAYENDKMSVTRTEAANRIGSTSWQVPTSGDHDGPSVDMTGYEILLMVAFHLNGKFTDDGAQIGSSNKQLHVRLLDILNLCGVPFEVQGDEYYFINKPDVPKYFSHVFNIPVTQFSQQQKQTFLLELSIWRCAENEPPFTFTYTSAIQQNVEYVSLMCVLNGFHCHKIVHNESHKTWSTNIDLDIDAVSMHSATVSEIPYSGKVYCVTVPTGMIVVRTDGYVSISGNCDKHALSYHDSDPDLSSAGDELRKSLPVIKELYELFPKMDILESNHGSLVWRKAKTHGIPVHYLKSYNDVLCVGPDWKWAYDMTITLPNGQQCYIHHGKSADVIKLSQQMGMNAVQGHYHNSFKIDFWGNPTGLYWGMQTGCLIDNSARAFAYNNVNIKRPIIGTGLIIDSIPVLEPMILDNDGKWTEPKL